MILYFFLISFKHFDIFFILKKPSNNHQIVLDKKLYILMGKMSMLGWIHNQRFRNDEHLQIRYNLHKYKGYYILSILVFCDSHNSHLLDQFRWVFISVILSIRWPFVWWNLPFGIFFAFGLRYGYSRWN